jgi:molecular chaperone GrpE (heat shock protein)
MSEPKTREEILEERLREINGRLSVVKKRLGSSKQEFTDKLERAEKRRKDAKGKSHFVKMGSSMVQATDRLDALLAMEECYEALMDLEGKEPVKEAEQLIARKIRVIEELMHLRGGST